MQLTFLCRPNNTHIHMHYLQTSRDIFNHIYYNKHLECACAHQELSRKFAKQSDATHERDAYNWRWNDVDLVLRSQKKTTWCPSSSKRAVNKINLLYANAKSTIIMMRECKKKTFTNVVHWRAVKNGRLVWIYLCLCNIRQHICI